MKILPVQRESLQYNNQPSFGLGVTPKTGQFIKTQLAICAEDSKLLDDVYNNLHPIMRFFKRPSQEQKIKSVISAYQNQMKKMFSWGGNTWKLNLEDPEIIDLMESRPKSPKIVDDWRLLYRNSDYSTGLSVKSNNGAEILKELDNERSIYLDQYNYLKVPQEEIEKKYHNIDDLNYAEWCSAIKSNQEFKLFKYILHINKRTYLDAVKEALN